MSLGYLVRFFLLFLLIFISLTLFQTYYSFSDIQHPPFRRNGGMRAVAEKTPKRCCMMSLGHLVSFFFFSFHFYITYSFFQITHSFSDIIHHLSMTMTARDDRRTRGMMRRTPKRRRMRFLGHVVCYFLLFPFISILLTFFSRYSTLIFRQPPPVTQQ